MKLSTTCEHTIWAGFFGINENGDQPECGEVIEIEVEEECVEVDRHGDVRPCFSVECPNCHNDLEWPQIWEVVKSHNSRKEWED
jgi:hypothetical protein